jgi:hypothetical protein
MSRPLILTQVNRHTLLLSQAGDIPTYTIGSKFSTNCITEIMLIAGLLTSVAHSLMHAGSQKIHQTVHAPPCLPVNAYDPKWLESRKTLYVRHVLCPKEEPYVFNHPPDVIAYVSPYYLNKAFI